MIKWFKSLFNKTPPGEDVFFDTKEAVRKIENGEIPKLIELQALVKVLKQAELVADAAAGSSVAIDSLVYNPQQDFQIGIKHWAAKLLAAHLGMELLEAGAKNYLELEFSSPKPEIGPIKVLIQRKYGKTPAQLNTELKAENAQLKEQISDLEAKLDDVL